MPRRPLFVYGTLLDPRIRRAVFGPCNLTPARPARLPGYRRVYVRGAAYPALSRRVGAAVQGMLLPPPDAWTLERLDAHEGDEYWRGPVTVALGDRLIQAETYLASPLARLTHRSWRLDARWARRRETYFREQFR